MLRTSRYEGTPGVDMTTGSLGQGLSAVNGMALQERLIKRIIEYMLLLVMGSTGRYNLGSSNV